MRRLLFNGVLLGTVFFYACMHTQAQQPQGPTMLVMADTGPYSMVERSDWRRYDNGKYIGHVYHEVRASIIPQAIDPNPSSPGVPAQNPRAENAAGQSLLYQGNFFVLEETLRDMRQSAQPVDAVIPVSFRIRTDGTITIDKDQGFPSLRGFPTFPASRVRPGYKWTAPGSRAVDPLHSGQPLIVPIIAEYEYKGTEWYQDVLVHRIFAQYSSRYQGASGRNTEAFTQLRDTHKVDILIRVEDGLPLFMRDSLDETYSWPDGSTVRFAGFTLTFGSGVVPMDKDEVVAILGNTLGIENVPEDPVLEPVLSSPELPPEEPPTGIPVTGLEHAAIDLVPVPEGVRLTVKDIRFVPDSSEFLAAEKPRLDLIAQALLQIPERSFLVEGHTAAAGSTDGDLELSIERAKRMVDELVSRGISPDRFIYKGWGSSKPLEDNATEQGRSRNRRVEITILE
ncbi:MAG: OmpA family protein [Treponema sp.]|jgi:outer membrane protein OmpA-like peptidoglycan-associated protein|nr:OmpA family protein [Treponema sp.]